MKLEFTVAQIAQLLQGKVKGDDSAVVTCLSKIEEAEKGAISFLSNPKYEPFVYSTNATAIIVGKDFDQKKEVKPALIITEDPYTAFTVLLEEYQKLSRFGKSGTEEPSFIGKNAITGENCFRGAFSYIGDACKIGNNVKIHAHVTISENVQIGENTIIFPGVKIYPNTVIGKNCVIHSGTVIGSDGFGFAPQKDGSYKPVPQVGNVILEDNVSIGANTVIDCATMGSTIIRKGAKIDNLVQIAHNVEIGKNTAMAAQSGISGSSKTGENCIIAGQAGIVGHLTLADRTTVAAKAGISKSVKKPGTVLLGSPAFEIGIYKRAYAVFKNLPELKSRIDKLNEKVLTLYSSKSKDR